MLVAAAVCPPAPVLVPEAARGTAPELDGLRAACHQALRAVASARPERLVVIGPAKRPGRPFPAGSRGSLRGFGVDVDVTLGTAGTARAGTPGRGEATGRALPPSLTVGAWLLHAAGWDASPVEALGVGEPLAAERCASVGRDLAAATPRLALLVMADGSARRTPQAPGSFDERAAAFDGAAARALAAADCAALARLDERLAEELLATGRSCWQVLGGAGEDAGLGGRIWYDDAPYGVGYLVASWS